MNLVHREMLNDLTGLIHYLDSCLMRCNDFLDLIILT